MVVKGCLHDHHHPSPPMDSTTTYLGALRPLGGLGGRPLPATTGRGRRGASSFGERAQRLCGLTRQPRRPNRVDQGPVGLPIRAQWTPCPCSGPNAPPEPAEHAPSNRRCGRLRAVWWRTPRDPPVRDCGRFGVKVGARGAQGSPRRRCRLRAGPWGGRGGRYGARGASGPLRVELASRLRIHTSDH